MIFLPNAFPAEALELLFAIISLPFLLWMLYDSWKAEKRRNEIGVDGPVSTLAQGNVLRGLFRATKSVLLILIGMISVLLPPPSAIGLIGDVVVVASDDVAAERRANSMVRILLMLVTGLLMLDAIVERLYRERARRLAEREMVKKSAHPQRVVETDIVTGVQSERVITPKDKL